MRSPFAPRAALLLACAALTACAALAGCAPDYSNIGALRVSVTTEGNAPDPDGYALVIDNGAPQAIGLNAELTVPDPGTGPTPGSAHRPGLELLRLGKPTQVSVEHSTTSVADFAVSCTASAFLRVDVTTTGTDPDPDGYMLGVGTGQPVRLLKNGMTSVRVMTPGQVPLTLSDLATNCTAAPSNPASVSVSLGEVASIALSVTCAPYYGALSIAVTASGPDAQGAGYYVVVDGVSLGDPYANPTNPVALPQVVPGSYQVSLEGVASNCSVTGDNPRTVTVQTGATTDVLFSLTCVALPRVIITAITTGASIDDDGYSVEFGDSWYGPYYRADLPPNGTTTIAGVWSGTYTAFISGVSPNCAITSAPPTFTMGASDVMLTLTVHCVTP